MKWIEVAIKTSHEAAEVIAELLHELGATGAVIDDPVIVNDYIDSGVWDYTDIPYAEDTSVVTVTAYLPDNEDLQGRLDDLKVGLKDIEARGTSIAPGEISTKPMEDVNWAENWKQYFHAERVSDHIVIKPTWEDYEAKNDDIVIELDPGEAFGTGYHPTTAMCIKELERLIKPDMKVFDVGTGSGILAIASVKLGAKDVTAVDYDKTALKVAKENLRQNHVDDVIKLGQSDIMKQVEGKADLVIANIIADIIIRLFDELEDHLNPGGKLLASGIIDGRAEDVVAAAKAHGLIVEKMEHSKEWTAMVLSYGR